MSAGCSSADDLILEVVVLLGTLAGDEPAAVVLLQRGLLKTLVSLINGKALIGGNLVRHSSVARHSSVVRHS